MSAEVIVLLVLLVWWHNLHAPDEPYQVIEYFAGVGRIAAVAKYQGYKTAAVDLEYGKDIPRKKEKRQFQTTYGSQWVGRPDVTRQMLSEFVVFVLCMLSLQHKLLLTL